MCPVFLTTEALSNLTCILISYLFISPELEIRQRKGSIAAGVVLLTVEDPEAHVGSGGATLNALLVAAEHLSARAGYTVR